MTFRWSHFAFASVSLLGMGLLLLSALHWGWIIPNEPPHSTFPVRGIDISHHNGSVDWAKVAQAGVTFAFLKATEGADWQDSTFPSHWVEAKAAGLITGAYHFFRTTSTGAEQAANIIDLVPVEEGRLPVVIDLEFSQDHARMTNDQFYRELDDLLSRTRDHYGQEPILYTTAEFHQNYLQDRAIVRLWARAVIATPRSWGKDWHFWQYSSRGRLPGVDGRVDLNVFRGTREEFFQYATR
ncbi:MAG: GH25 family lysozyme [Verrucomicrobiota bacterium]